MQKASAGAHMSCRPDTWSTTSYSFRGCIELTKTLKPGNEGSACCPGGCREPLLLICMSANGLYLLALDSSVKYLSQHKNIQQP